MYVPCLLLAVTLFECCSSDCQDADGYPGTTNKRVRLLLLLSFTVQTIRNDQNMEERPVLMVY